jgi:hypothetical protein
MVSGKVGVWILRIMLIFWLSFSQKADDELFGVLTSIRRFNECRRLVKDKPNKKYI